MLEIAFFVKLLWFDWRLRPLFPTYVGEQIGRRLPVSSRNFMCARLRAGHFQSRVILVYIIGFGIPIGLEAYAVDCSDVIFIMSGID